MGGGELTFGEFSSLSLLEAGVGVLELKFTENSEGFALTLRSEHLGVVHDEDKSVSLSKGNTGHTGELLHADLKKSLAALLLTTVKLRTV